MAKKTNPKFWQLIIISLICIHCQIASGQNFIYVDSIAPAFGDGLSWGTAYRFLQDALADANTHAKPVEIWVAEGIYQPDLDEGGNVTPGDSNATFGLINGVALYGGFPPGGMAPGSSVTQPLAQRPLAATLTEMILMSATRATYQITQVVRITATTWSNVTI